MEKELVQYVVLRVCAEERRRLREWLSGGVSPCQGEGRGFESRLALVWKTGKSLEEHGVLWFFLYSYI